MYVGPSDQEISVTAFEACLHAWTMVVQLVEGSAMLTLGTGTGAQVASARAGTGTGLTAVPGAGQMWVHVLVQTLCLQIEKWSKGPNALL